MTSLGKNRTNQRGFSLIEMLIVTSIALCVAGVAVPKMMTSMADLELRGSIHTASGILQLTRMQAIKVNHFYTAKYTNVPNEGGVIFADLDNDGNIGAKEPQGQLGNTVLAYSAPTGIPALTTTDLNYSPVTTSTVSFSPVGQPCTSQVFSTCNQGMVVYFHDTRTLGNPGWAAVSVSPAGRIACWMWNGAAWKQQ